jgi:hypothetical protein
MGPYAEPPPVRVAQLRGGVRALTGGPTPSAAPSVVAWALAGGPRNARTVFFAADSPEIHGFWR